ncbi:MAG: hypothetical protein HKN67_07655 [Saprospiraceae bacterium]|nr:FIST C-terminal domain-containing protein [Bacteroidia bacterium]NNF21800.1 hypothetical protein [Saprospiraceae bacterium]
MIYSDTSSDILLKGIRAQFDPSQGGLLICVSESCQLSISDLVSGLNQHEYVFLGIIVPGVIEDLSSYDNKVLVKQLQFTEKPVIVSGLEEGEFDIPEIELDRSGSVMVFVDGKSDYISRFLMVLYNKISFDKNIMGSGLSVISENNRASIFTSVGFHDNSAAILSVSSELVLGVKHGLKKIHGPIIATRTDNNRIEELNWEPAIKVYGDVIKDITGEVVSQDNYVRLFQKFPLGMNSDSDELQVRDTVSYDADGNLICMAEIFENSVLHIMNGNIDDYLSAARLAAEEAIGGMENKNIDDVFIIDCICRYNILDTRYNEELRIVKDVYKSKFNKPLEGILSTGEISSAKKGILDLNNETIVIGNFYKE